MENKKMTKAQAWNIVRGIVLESEHPQTVELLEKIDNELTLLAKKNSTERKNPTADANAALRAEIFNSMAEGERYTISDMIKKFPACAGLSNQKVAAVMRGFDATVVKETEKGKSYWKKA